jgi:hypothetical protein
MPSNDDCGPLVITCKDLEKILKDAGRLENGCKLAEGDPKLRKRGEKVYVFDLIPGSESDERAVPAKTRKTQKTR